MSPVRRRRQLACRSASCAQYALRQRAEKGRDIALDLAEPYRPVRLLEDDRQAVLDRGKAAVPIGRDGAEGEQLFRLQAVDFGPVRLI
jgi:hypothetical protein